MESPGRGLATLREGVVIVFSVLIALGADAWWDGRSERRAEVEYLDALAEELEALRAGVREAIAEDSTHLTRTAAYVARLYAGGGPPVPVDSVPYLASLNYSNFNPPRGILRVLSSTEVSTLVSSRSLRSAITALEGQFIRTETFLDRSEAEAWGLLGELVRAQERLWDANGRQPPEGAFLLQPSVVARDPDVRAAYGVHTGILSNRLYYLRRLGNAIGVVESMLNDR